MMAGFGSAYFQHQPGHGQEVATVDKDKLLLFDLSEEEFVLHNGKLESLGELLQARETEKGKVAVCYHEVAVKPGESLGQYHAQVTRKHQFYFKPKKQAEKEGANLELLQEGHFVLCRSVPFST